MTIMYRKSEETTIKYWKSVETWDNYVLDKQNDVPVTARDGSSLPSCANYFSGSCRNLMSMNIW